MSEGDLTSYLRCPYAWWHIEQGLLTRREAAGDLGRQLMIEASDFSALVESDAERLQPGTDPRSLRGRDATFSRWPRLRNEELQIQGSPRLVDVAEGALVPVKVRTHGEVGRHDRLALAFLWLVLEPYRTRAIEPQGRLVLRRGGLRRDEVVRLGSHLDDVQQLIDEIRDARRRGVKARVCACAACRGPLREQVEIEVKRRKALTMITGIGKYERHLERGGITNYDELLTAAPADVVALIKAGLTRGGVSEDEVRRWQHHARSYATGEAVCFGEPPPIGDAYFALDLEYLCDGRTEDRIFLIGACLVTPDDRSYRFWWADSSDEEGENLPALSAWVSSFPDLPVVTWSGDTADVDQLRKATRRLDLGTALDPVIARHVDLCGWMQRSARLPIPGYKLKDVAPYFDVSRVSAVGGGLDAQLRYKAYLRLADGGRRDELRNEVIEYNGDDLNGLVAVVDGCRRLADVNRARLDHASRSVTDTHTRLLGP